MRSLIVVSVGVAMGLASPSALASEIFPGTIQQHLSLTYSPPCSLCHAGGVTGFGTVTTPFGAAMRARGLVARDTNSLASALDKMAAEGVDSNGDGVTDIDELKAGTDPNAGAPGAVPPPEFGCTVGSGGDPPTWGWVLFAAAFVLALRRRQ